MFYKSFEDVHRGSRSVIKKRLEVYLPFVTPLLECCREVKAVDIGCGRGEWLEVLNDAGFLSQGVDLDEGMLSLCYEMGLDVEKRDALEFLKNQSNESCFLISAFHVIEHVSFQYLRDLVKEIKRVLRPGGVLILETPNPENLVVASSGFYTDPTHVKPIPPGLLHFVVSYEEFGRVKLLRLNENKDDAKQEAPRLTEVVAGVSPDYAVVAQKQGPLEIFQLLDPAFAMNYGLSLNDLLQRFDDFWLAEPDSFLSFGRDKNFVKDLKRQTEELTRREAETQRKSAALEVAAQLAETRATTVLAELQKSQAELSVLGRELEKVNISLNEKAAVLADSEQRNLAIQASLDETVAKTNLTKIELSRSLYYQESLLVENKNMTEEIAKKSEELEFLYKSMKGLSDDLESARIDLYNMHWFNHNNVIARQKYQGQLEAVYKSTSWRVSAPLRWLKRLILFLLRLPRLLLVTVLRYLIAALQWPLAHGMRWVARRPWAKRRAVALLQYFPGMQSQFREIAYRYGVVVPKEDDFEGGVLHDESVPDEEPVAPVADVCIEKTELDFELSPRAQRIYCDLKADTDRHGRGQ